jgi:hypothetical protein
MNYNNYQPTLKLIANDHHSDMSTVNLAFLKAKESFNPELSQFLTWLNIKAKGEISNEFKGNNNYQKYIDYNADCYLSPRFICQEKEVIFWQTIERLSEDARLICNLIFNPPEAFSDLVKIRGNGTTKTNLKIIKEYLIEDLRWSQKKVEISFKEIKKALQSIE